jgi:hypothetical protein
VRSRRRLQAEEEKVSVTNSRPPLNGMRGPNIGFEVGGSQIIQPSAPASGQGVSFPGFTTTANNPNPLIQNTAQSAAHARVQERRRKESEERKNSVPSIN